MPNLPITGLPTLSSQSGSDVLVVVETSSGVTKKETRSSFGSWLASLFVSKTGSETIAGTKTFSSIPVLPASDPTTDNQASRKKYVDDQDALKVSKSGDSMSGDLDMTGNSIYDVNVILAGGSIYAVDIAGRVLHDLLGKPVAKFDDVSDGFAVNSDGINPKWAILDASNLASDQTFSFPSTGGVFATEDYANSLVVGLWDDRGSFDASGNLFPSSGGSGTAGAIQKGDIWTISVAGTLGGSAVLPGDTVRALVDTPGQTSTNWAIAENNIGYVPVNKAGDTITGTIVMSALNASEILELNGSKQIVSAAKGTAYNKNFGTASSTVCEGNDSRLRQDYIIQNPFFFDDFNNSNLWTQSNSNGGTVVGDSPQTGERGVVRVFTGANSNGSASIRRGVSFEDFAPGQFAFTFIAKVRTTLLSDATNEYNCLIGLNDSITTDGTDGVYFRYIQSASGNFWVCVTRSNSVETRTVTTAAVNSQAVHYLKCEINAAGTSAVFSVANGTAGSYSVVATHTTNIPTGSGRDLTSVAFINKTAGTTARFLTLDYWFEQATSINR